MVRETIDQQNSGLRLMVLTCLYN